MLWVLFTLIYVQTGYQLGKKAGRVWKEGDSESLESFLFFPVSHARGKVGDPDAPLVGPIHEGDVLYRTLITLGWPVMAAWNLLLIGGLLGPDKVIRRLTGQHKADRYKALESRLIKEEKKVDRVIRRLEAPKRQRKPREPMKPKALPASVPSQADPGHGSEARTGHGHRAPTQPAVERPAETAHAAADFSGSPGGRRDADAEAAFFKERLFEPQAGQADPSPSPVQVRVTVDVTAPGPAAEETASRDERPGHEDAPAASAHRGGRQDTVH